MKTKSEILFEGFLTANNLPFEKIQEQTTRTPDYRISVGGSEIIFELKELAADKNFGVVKDPAYPHIKSNSRTLGDHVRRRIESSKKQIQFGAKQKIPSVGLVQRQGPDAPGNEKHVVQRRRPSMRPGWKDDGHALRERLRQGQNSLRPVAPLL